MTISTPQHQSTTPADRLRDALSAGAAQAVALLQALVGRQEDGEPAVQALVAEHLVRLGATVKTLDYVPQTVPMVAEFAAPAPGTDRPRRSVVGTIGAKVSGGRSLLLFAHPDTEATTSLAGWRKPPHDGVIADGRIYGWGIADDLAGLATALAALDAIAAAGLALGGDVALASTPSKQHARGIAAVLNHGVTADAALYLHPAESGAGLHDIKAMASGQLEFSVTITGRQPQTHEPGHTAFAHLAVNPLDKAILLIAALRRLDTERAARVHHPLLDAAVGRSTNLMISALQFGPAEALSRMPQTLMFSGAIAFPPGESLETVQREIAAALYECARYDGWLSAHPPVLTWASGVTGSEVTAQSALFSVLAGAIAETAGFTPTVNAMHTSSDIRIPLVQKSIPTLGFGPLCGGLTHAGDVDEWVDQDDFLRAVTVTALCILAWCGSAA